MLKNSALITIDIQGADRYTKLSYPVKYGHFSRLESRDYIFEFNLNHEIRHARSKRKAWLHPSEWLKRTPGNDWVYYSTGGYAGVFEALGEYYLPNLPYPTNSLMGAKPFEEPEVHHLVSNWHDILLDLIDNGEMISPVSEGYSDWLEGIRQNTQGFLEDKAQKLFKITSSRGTVLPPDSRHVDYNLIPLTLADGCLYKCKFCKVKNRSMFAVRSKKDIHRQMEALKTWYGPDILNYNALFLGEHDALSAPPDIIFEVARDAYNFFDFSSSFMKDGPFLFMFGSADSFLSFDPVWLKKLGEIPFKIFINVGLESCDQATLDILGKPLSAEKILLAFERAQELNDSFSFVEVSVNFVMDESLPVEHEEKILSLIRQSGRIRNKGSIYISPSRFDQPSRELLYKFYRMKALSRFPLFLYLIQRF